MGLAPLAAGRGGRLCAPMCLSLDLVLAQLPALFAATIKLTVIWQHVAAAERTELLLAHLILGASPVGEKLGHLFAKPEEFCLLKQWFPTHEFLKYEKFAGKLTGLQAMEPNDFYVASEELIKIEGACDKLANPVLRSLLLLLPKLNACCPGEAAGPLVKPMYIEL